MAGISRFEKGVLLLTAGFVLFAGGWFLAGTSSPEPYTITVSSQESEPPAPDPALENKPASGERPDSLLPDEVININTRRYLRFGSAARHWAHQGGGHPGLPGGTRSLPAGRRPAGSLWHWRGHPGKPAPLCDGGRSGRGGRRITSALRVFLYELGIQEDPEAGIDSDS